MPAGKTRNPEIAPGIRKLGRGAAFRKRGGWIKKAKAAGKPIPKHQIEGQSDIKAEKPKPKPKVVPFGKGTRTIQPKGPGFYPADRVYHKLGNNKHARPARLRSSLVPGAVLIMLAGRFRGRRVVLLKQLESGLLLVTGPYRVNGVPLRRVNHRYVIGTSTHVDISGIKLPENLDDKYFRKDKARRSKDEGAFFGDKSQKKKAELPASRRADQRAVDEGLLAVIKKTPQLKSYLGHNFTLRHGQYPHALKF